MTRANASLSDLLGLDVDVDVVDIGSNPVGDEPPYKVLLNAGVANVVGFEPNPVALDKLNAQKGPRENYLSDAVFDGREHELKLCQSSGMTSLLEPNHELLHNFHGFARWSTVVERRVVKTSRLDDIAEVRNIDYLKIDIQGAELEVFRNGMNRLSDCTVIQTEVEFLPMYIGQPLFSEVEMFLRELGFLFHRFFPPPIRRTIMPAPVTDKYFGQMNQVVWADAVFVKDFMKLDRLPASKLKKLAVILHDVYGSYDISLRALMECDRKEDTKLSERYMRFLEARTAPNSPT
jgi:FkbM family methyltransferase